MKGNKVMITLIAAFSVISVVVAFTYAWFFTSNKSEIINVSTTSVDIINSQLLQASNKLPGESVLLNESDMTKITNAGKANAIIQISFKDTLAAYFYEEPPNNFKKDYVKKDDRWYVGEERLKKIANIEMKLNRWVKIGTNYYAPIKAKSNIPVDKIFLNITGELGGYYSDTNEGKTSLLRSFEQSCIFEVQYNAVAVQATREAMEEVFDKKVANTIPNEWYN